jgi:flavin-dependent dehydrogenase
MTDMPDDRTGVPVEIVGAGPAGLSAALAARARGREVIVYERESAVGARFHGDQQGLENWTREEDVLAELDRLGVATTFDHAPVYELTCFDPRGAGLTLSAVDPIFYLIRRGPGVGTLDQALAAQALAADATIRFSTDIRHSSSTSIIAIGPHRADVVAAGYVLRTDMADGCFVAVSNDLAPAGYSYLLVNGGRGTVATCMFGDFHRERAYLERTVEFFRQAAGLRWHAAERFGGVGNVSLPQDTRVGSCLYAGEAAGFQDGLFGFGLRYAMLSGHLAGDAVARGQSQHYAARWRDRLGALVETAIGNRWLYRKLGDRGRCALLRRYVAGRDVRSVLRHIYAPSWWQRLIGRLAPSRPLLRVGSIPEDCDCTWCRCQRHHHPAKD